MSFYQSFICLIQLHLAPVLTGRMKGRVIQLFLVAIFCGVACSMLLHRTRDIVIETRPSSTLEFSFENVERNSSEDCNVSATTTHNFCGLLQSLFVWEVEENDDDKEESDFSDEQGNLAEAHKEAAVANFLRQASQVPAVPLFIFLHSWKHFLP
jgi:hypothetical protein